MGDVEGDDGGHGWGGDSLDGGLEEDGGGRAVYVVIAVDEDGLGAGDGELDAGYGGSHAEEEVGGVEVVQGGVKEGFGVGDVARGEEGGDGGRAG